MRYCKQCQQPTTKLIYCSEKCRWPERERIKATIYNEMLKDWETRVQKLTQTYEKQI